MPTHRTLTRYATLVVGPAGPLAGAGTRMLVPQLRHRTVFPRQVGGTSSTFLQVRFGHMMRTLWGWDDIIVCPVRVVTTSSAPPVDFRSIPKELHGASYSFASADSLTPPVRTAGTHGPPRTPGPPPGLRWRPGGGIDGTIHVRLFPATRVSNTYES